MSTIFQQIIDGNLPADKVFEDDKCLAFKDINAVAPCHILVIPKRAIPRLRAAQSSDAELLGHLMLVATQVAAEQGLEGYRLVVNDGAIAGQTVFHLHLHVIGGRDLSWPPG